ncbi:MAG: hypothetical protein HYR56_10410 [Acidobacteria bacterium]|nr:hypothetical protein [Acidobacteriota bacterium]MBI3425627.1 hypothetical protein [Acidobacteriota bacterium]
MKAIGSIGTFETKHRAEELDRVLPFAQHLNSGVERQDGETAKNTTMSFIVSTRSLIVGALVAAVIITGVVVSSQGSNDDHPNYPVMPVDSVTQNGQQMPAPVIPPVPQPSSPVVKVESSSSPSELRRLRQQLDYIREQSLSSKILESQYPAVPAAKSDPSYLSDLRRFRQQLEHFREQPLEAKYNHALMRYLLTLRKYDKELEKQRSIGTIKQDEYVESHGFVVDELEKSEQKGEYMDIYNDYLDKYKKECNWVVTEIARQERIQLMPK